jgi:hypothetical protein
MLISDPDSVRPGREKVSSGGPAFEMRWLSSVKGGDREEGDTCMKTSTYRKVKASPMIILRTRLFCRTVLP